MNEKITQVHEVLIEMKDFKVTRLEVIINYNQYEVLVSYFDKPITLTQAQRLIKERLTSDLKDALKEGKI